MNIILLVVTLVYVAVLLTVSFFVLFTAGKAQSKKLKIFGQIIAVLLWIAVALIVFSGMYLSLSGQLARPMMRGGMPQQQQQMMKP